MFSNTIVSLAGFVAKFERGIALLAAAFMMCLPVHAGADVATDDNSVVKQLVENLTPLYSLTGAFDQRQTGSEGELLSESSGRFKMQRPGMLRWQTMEPFPQLLVTDGAEIWMYDPDLEQVTISKVASQLMNTPAVIFSGDLAQLNKRYRITSSEAGRYRLRPRDSNNSFQRLDLAFADGALSEMIILDSFGQLTEFKLRDVEPVESIAVEEFQFIPPEGTDVFFNE